MNYLTLTRIFADTYSCGTYGSGNFNDNQCATVAGGALSPTGTDVAIGIGIGIVLIVIAVIVILKNRKKK